MEQFKELYEKMEQEYLKLKKQNRSDDWLQGYRASLWDLKIILQDDFDVPTLKEI